MRTLLRNCGQGRVLSVLRGLGSAAHGQTAPAARSWVRVTVLARLRHQRRAARGRGRRARALLRHGQLAHPARAGGAVSVRWEWRPWEPRRARMPAPIEAEECPECGWDRREACHPEPTAPPA